MAREYGVIYARYWEWCEEKGLSHDAMLIGAYLLTCRYSNALGCFRVKLGVIAEELRYPFETVSKGFQELSETGIGFLKYCETSRHVLLQKYLKWNVPQNVNVGKHIMSLCEAIPSSFTFFDELVACLQAYPDKLPVNGIETVSKRFRIPDPDPYPEEKKEKDAREGDPPPPGEEDLQPPDSGPKKLDCPSKSRPSRMGFMTCFQVYPIQQGEEEAWCEWCRLEDNGTLEESFVIRDNIVLMAQEDDNWKAGYAPAFAKYLKGKRWNDKPVRKAVNTPAVQGMSPARKLESQKARALQERRRRTANV